MKLNSKTRYGLRMLFQLALHYEKGSLQLNEIARREHISEKYLEQIVGVLRSAGLVVSQRGAQGGYSLSRSPERIDLSEIVGSLEGGLNITDCLSSDFHCEQRNNCVTRGIWGRVNRALLDALKQISLEDMLSEYRFRSSGTDYSI